jgi:hypothetical protein
VTLASGIAVGLALFFVCYWWLGSITLSAVVGVVAVAGAVGIGRWRRAR